MFAIIIFYGKFLIIYVYYLNYHNKDHKKNNFIF